MQGGLAAAEIAQKLFVKRPARHMTATSRVSAIGDAETVDELAFNAEGA